MYCARWSNLETAGTGERLVTLFILVQYQPCHIMALLLYLAVYVCVGSCITATACVMNLRHFVVRWYSQLRELGGFGCNFPNIWFYYYKYWYCQSIVT
jgi:hypothetical protein